ncbi:NAD-dependent epimerase/dehydratase family protein [Fictibacillus nanhaiensis]|uniref:NAD-dependent epimerase/dehydratase family protein n=1 Tax=Fictibacillus nanhaiensis TaxID=742169 RepID=UPI001C97C99A|nr:NAD-dependent epimerase/dehydratase family protein [Fictibacillus nanhaiensis]MBY6037182.1 NAD-dependent epimerase/dehydratase family protein [Fictibacillus nanhaiensis]
MKALVTGGAGFIGSNVVKYLLEREWEVRVIDNLSSGYKYNLDGLDVEFIEGDICDPQITMKACEGRDVVFHLAACVGRQKSLDDPQLDSNINLLGTVNILEGMRKHGVKRIVYSSSAAIFGELITPTIDENHPQNADSPYGVSKLAAEKMILAYSGIFDITGICLRYFNIYGVNQRYDLYGNVIPIFAKRIFSGEPITIYGDGEQTRDFVNVCDVARANYLAATTDKGTGVYNLGSGNSITINKLAEMMQEMSGINVGEKYESMRPADVRHCKAKTDKVKNELRFETSIILEKGLLEYMSWFKENCVKLQTIKM